jgi:hypothetical protein
VFGIAGNVSVRASAVKAKIAGYVLVSMTEVEIDATV